MNRIYFTAVLLIFMISRVMLKCEFHLSSLPIPSNALILGDVRKNEKCKSHSITSSRPPTLPDPTDGLRLWTKEDHYMATSGESMVAEATSREEVEEMMFLEYNIILRHKGDLISSAQKAKNNPNLFRKYPPNAPPRLKFEYIQIPKTGSTSFKINSGVKFRNRKNLEYSFELHNLTLASVRHPISRLISGIGTMSDLKYSCSERIKSEFMNSKFHGDLLKACGEIEKVTQLMRDTSSSSNKKIIPSPQELDDMVSLAIKFLEKWSVAPTVKLAGSWYWNHLSSQMFFYNMIPPSYGINPSFPPSLYQVDVSIRQEMRNEAVLEFCDQYPLYQHNFHICKESQRQAHQQQEQQLNKKAGRKNWDSDDHVTMSCDTAWRIYEYFIQDFECLGYELPPECLKEECKKKLS